MYLDLPCSPICMKLSVDLHSVIIIKSKDPDPSNKEQILPFSIEVNSSIKDKVNASNILWVKVKSIGRRAGLRFMREITGY